jgi:hypothetical protein
MMRPLLTSLALFLSGCVAAVSDGYPSLAPRRSETAEVAPEQPAVRPSATEDPALQAEIERLGAQADAGSKAFDRDYPDAERSVRAAQGAAVSSEAWVSAQVAISGLETSRNEAVSALAALDTLYAERVNAVADGRAQGGADAIDDRRRDVLGAVDSQNDRLDALKSQIPQD